MKLPTTIVPLSLVLSIACLKLAQCRIINAGSSVFAPYYAKLTGYSADFSRFSRGSGTFITRRHIVTSATFVVNVSQVVVQYGSSELSEMVEKRFYPDIRTYPNYNPETFANDLAIIILPTEIDHGGTGGESKFYKFLKFPPCCLSVSVTPIALMRDLLQPRDRVGDVVGFGWRPEGSQWLQNDRMVSFQSSWMSVDECSGLLGERVEVQPFGKFCAGDIFEVSSVCHGDLGAGFVMYMNAVHYLTGVLSVFTHMCNPKYPAVYTKIAQYTDWIDSVVDN